MRFLIGRRGRWAALITVVGSFAPSGTATADPGGPNPQGSPPPPADYPASFYTGPAGQGNILPVFGKAFLGLSPGGIGFTFEQGSQQQRDRETAIGHTIPINSRFQSGCTFPTAHVQSMAADGWIPLISWQFDTALDEVTNGSQNACIDSWAAGAVAYGQPLMVRLWHEFNGDWMPWSFNANGSRATPAQFVASWRYLITRMQTDGVTNISWVWSPQEGFYGNGDSYDETLAYPGDAYVDWVGSDGYNMNDPGAYCGAMGNPHPNWCTFEEVFHDSIVAGGNVEQDFRGQKPMMVAETGSNNGTAGQKAQWLVDARDRIKAVFPGLLAFVYFDINVTASEGCCNWRLDSQTDVISNGFKPLADDPYFQG
jgi:Glycosyl hydrolase family 26